MLNSFNLLLAEIPIWISRVGDRIWQIIFAALVASIAMLQPVVPLFFLCLAAILADTFTSWDLQKRLRRLNPEYDKKLGKFRSDKFRDTIRTIIYLVLLLTFAGFADSLVLLSDTNIAARWTAGIFGGWQLWSVIENISSASNSKWAKLIQIIAIDKAERYLGIPLDDFKALIKKQS